MDFEQKQIPGTAPPASDCGCSAQKHKVIKRPDITKQIEQLDKALEQKPSGDPVARCVECKKKCEDCAIGCQKGHYWSEE